MIKLIKNEIFKVLHKKSIYISMAIILGLVLLFNYISTIDIGTATNNYNYSKENISYLQSELDTLNPSLESDLSEYISTKSTLDYINFVLNYENGTWQRYIAENKASELFNTLNTAKYLAKNETAIKEAESAINSLKDKLSGTDWQAFAREDKDTTNKQIEALNKTISTTSDKSTIADLNKQISTLKYHIEALDMRLDNNIAYGDDYLNNSLLTYETQEVSLLNFNNDNLSEEEKKAIASSKASIALCKYQIDNKVNLNDSTSAGNMFKNSTNSYIELFIIATIMVTCFIVSEEFNKGTIKVLLTRPYTRNQILLSKYITCILVSLFNIILIYLFQFFIGCFFAGFSTYSALTAVYDYATNTIIEMSIFKYALLALLGYLPKILLLLTLSFTISTIMASTSAALIFPIIVLIFSEVINSLVTFYQVSWMRYFPTLNWDLNQFFYGATTVYKYDSLTQSIIVSAIYLIIMLVVSFIFFKKKDIKNI